MPPILSWEGKRKGGEMDTHQLFGQSLAANHTRHHHFWDGKDMAISSMWCL